MKDENKLDELLEVLNHYHSSVPKTADNELDQKTVLWSGGVTFLAIVECAKNFCNNMYRCCVKNKVVLRSANLPDLFDDEGDTTFPEAPAPELDSEEEKRYVSIKLHPDDCLLSITPKASGLRC